MQGMRTMGLAVAVLGVALTVVAVAEDVTVSTYYPSPKGVYQQLRTTGNTMLANQGGAVTVGAVATPASLTVNGAFNATGAAAMAGTLTVTGATTLNSTLNVTGNTTVATLAAGNTTVGPLTAGATTITSFRMATGAPQPRKALVSDNAGNGTWDYPYAVYE